MMITSKSTTRSHVEGNVLKYKYLCDNSLVHLLAFLARVCTLKTFCKLKQKL